MITIHEVNLTREILEEIREMDLEFCRGIGPIDWYLDRYKPWHTALVAREEEKIIGYLAYLPIRKELYEAVVNGVLVDDLGISPDMFLKESPYYYAGSILIREEYRGRNLSRQLLDAYAERYPEKKTCLIAISGGGYRLARHYFTLVKETAGSIGIFVSHPDSLSH